MAIEGAGGGDEAGRGPGGGARGGAAAVEDCREAGITSSSDHLCALPSGSQLPAQGNTRYLSISSDCPAQSLHSSELSF